MILILVNIMYPQAEIALVKVFCFVLVVLMNNIYTIVLLLLVVKTKFMAIHGKKLRPIMRKVKE